jgi:hypothetical protein
MSRAFPISGPEAFQARLDTVLQGRKVNPWSESVGLARATAQRLAHGNFPDPEKLIQACRVERLSLTWLLDGLGVPFLVYPAESDHAGARRVRQLLSDEPQQRVVIAHSDRGFCVLLQQDVQVQASNVPVYSYTSIEVIGGGALGAETANATMAGDYSTERTGDVESLGLSADEWSALATGRMGNVPLIGWAKARGGLLDSTKPLLRDTTAHGVMEPGAVYGGLDPDESEVLSIFRGLETGERQLILRQLRALRR